MSDVGIVICKKCGNKVRISMNVITPNNRAELIPINNIISYRITSEQIVNHLVKKINEYKAGAKLKAVPEYCENKHRSPNNRKGFAIFKIAMSDDILENKNDSFYHKLGNIDKVNITESVLNEFIRKFGYTKAEIDGLLDYKNLEYVENEFGMTKSFIENIKAFIIPKKIVDSYGKSWIIFAAKSDEIIKDMLEDPDTNKLNGRLEIRSVNQINKDAVEFIVYIHTGDIELQEDPIVRKLLLGVCRT
jgi:hypothetical protein